MRVGISDKYLDRFYLPLIDNFDYIEYQVYEKKDLLKLDRNEKKCFIHLCDPASSDFIELVKEISVLKNVDLVNIHARPFGDYVICKECGSRVYVYKNSELYCPECEYLYTQEELNKDVKNNDFELVIERIIMANDILKDSAIKLSVENTFEPLILMQKIFDHLPDDIGFTCDIGHANLFYSSSLDYISALRDRLIHLHIHDNFGGYSDWYHDMHISPGRGAIKWEAVINLLNNIQYKGTGTFESKATLNWVDRFRSIKH